MKKNLYYRTVFMRTNAMKELILVFFLAICSWPRLLLEVFLRKNMGERYFSFSAAIIMSGLLAIIPLIYAGIMERITGQSYSAHLIAHYMTWYVFLALFLYTCWERWKEIQRLPSVFDFGRFSLSAGIISSHFTRLKFFGKPVDVRLIETVLEPGFFFILGFVFWMAAQSIGMVLMLSSICYSFSYVGAYHQGDHFIMDKIDEMICNEEMVNAFVEGKEPSKTRGVNFYGRRPADPDVRRRLVDGFIDDDTVEAL